MVSRWRNHPAKIALPVRFIGLSILIHAALVCVPVGVRFADRDAEIQSLSIILDPDPASYASREEQASPAGITTRAAPEKSEEKSERDRPAAVSAQAVETVEEETPARRAEATTPLAPEDHVQSGPDGDEESASAPGEGNGPSGSGQAAAVGSDEPVLAQFGTANGPSVIDMAAPVYPALARRRRLEGRVVVRLDLDSTGAVKEVVVIEPAGYGFDEAAVAAVERSRFGPAERDGKPVACQALLPIRFALRSGR